MNWKLIGSSLRNSEMRKKILGVLGILVVYRLLAHIPFPLAEPEQLEVILNNLINAENTPQLLSFINVLSGGALASLSIMLVGLGPYINASIILQIMTNAIPKLEALKQDGEYGQKKINQYTRMLSLPLAVIQSIGAIFLVGQIANQFSGLGNITADATLSQWVLMVSALTAGAMILMWLGELITEKNVGNGISLLITVGIVSQLPLIGGSIYDGITTSNGSYSVFGIFDLPLPKDLLIFYAILILSTFLITLFVVYLNEAQRRVKISYAKKIQGNRAYGDVSTVLPIKMITAGVIPIIFAVAFLSIPQLFGQLFSSSNNSMLANWANNLNVWFSAPGTQNNGEIFATATEYIYPVTYFLLVALFTYFYTGVVFNSKEISEQLQRQGGFIEDVRPGDPTRKRLAEIVNRLNLFGATSLGLLALSPILLQVLITKISPNVSGAAANLALGGTSILILVSVALETLRKVESKALMVTYDDYDHNLTVANKGKRKSTRRQDNAKESDSKKSLIKLFTRRR